MKIIGAIAWRDFKSYFTSPMGYILMAFFMAMMGYMFFGQLSWFAAQSMQHNPYGGGQQSIADGVVRPLFQNMFIIHLLVLPAITMRLFAEEKKLHTYELLQTAPITLTHIVLGKFFSGLYFLLAMLAPTLVYPIILYIWGNPEFGPILTCYLGTILLYCSYIAIGMFFSSMTENQIVAFVSTFFTLLFLWIIAWMSQSVGKTLGDVLTYLSIIHHFITGFGQGIINSVDVVYYLSVTGVFLFLTHRVLDSYRWR